MSRFLAIGAAVAVLAAGTAAAAQKKSENTPPAQLQRLLDCRGVADPAQRLACFDRETAATAEAITKREIVAVDRQKARKAQRSLFGFSVPDFGIFGGDEADEITQIDGVVAGVGQSADGFIVRLQDGSEWAQTDGKPVALEPRRGDKVVIKRGSLGSFKMNLAGQPAVKVKRIG